MLISSGIMFLMYRFGRLVALVYIRKPWPVEKVEEPKPTRASIVSWWHHPRPRATHKRAK